MLSQDHVAGIGHDKYMLGSTENQEYFKDELDLTDILTVDEKMTILDDLPEVTSLFGIDLRSAVFIIAALGIVHPLFCGYTCFMPLSYLMVSMWILVALYAGASLMLLFGVIREDSHLIQTWEWFALFFVVIMILMLCIFSIIYCINSQVDRIICIVLTMCWYILVFYFIIVVNSYRKKVGAPATLTDTVGDNLDFQEMKADMNFSSRQYPNTMSNAYNSTTATKFPTTKFRAWVDDNDDEETE